MEEQEKNVKKIGTVGLIVLLCITMIITTAVIIGVYFLVLNPNKDKMQNDFDLIYDIVLDDWKDNSNGNEGGFSSIYSATLVNSDKKEMYEIKYSDVYEVHENRGAKDFVTINVNKIPEKKFLDIINKYTKQKNNTINNFLSKYIKKSYDLKIVYQNIDYIKYDIIVDTKVSVIEASDKSKTGNGIYAIEHYYELINSELKTKYRVYCDNLAEVYNNEGEDDIVIVEYEKITDNEIKDISMNKEKSQTLQNLTDLVKGNFTEDYIISLVEY